METAEIETETLAVDSIVTRRGYFTKRHTLGDLRDANELERRIGYGPGLLRLGWYVLLMVERTPQPDEFELGGYSHFSGSQIRGHSANPGPHVEKSLQADAVDVMRSRALSAANFTLTGPTRLAKVVPVIKTGTYWHPDPNPIPQWRLTAPMKFVVSAFYPGADTKVVPKPGARR